MGVAMTATAHPFDGREQLWRLTAEPPQWLASRGKSAMRPIASGTASSAVCRRTNFVPLPSHGTVHVVPRLTSPAPVPGSPWHGYFPSRSSK